MKRRIVSFLGALLVLLALAPSAQACSCMRGDPRTQLDQADGAFIGRLVSADPAPPNASDRTYHFKVDEVVKGDIGDTIDVGSGGNGAMCGFEVAPGQQMGFFLDRSHSQWRGGLCGQISPDDLRKAAAPYPTADGSGRLSVLVGGRWGEVRTLGLDAQGKTLRYGKGEGVTNNLSVCPGSRVAAEIAVTFDGDKRRRYLVLRDLDTFGGFHKEYLTGLDAPGAGHYPLEVSALSCRSPSGDDVVFFAANNEADQTEATGKLIRVHPDGQTVLWQGGLGGAADIPASGSKAYIATRTDKLIEVDLATRAVRDIAKTAGTLLSGPVLSPDGRSVAMQRPREGGIDLYDVRTGTVATNKSAAGNRMLWASDDRLVVTGADDNGVIILDRSLETVDVWSGWTGDKSIVVDGTLYGTNYQGELVSAPVLQGPTKVLRTFDSPELDVIAAVPPKPTDPDPAPAVTAQPSARPTSEPTTQPSSEPTSSPAGFAAPTSAPAERTGGSSALPAAALGVSAFALSGAVFAWRRRSS
jgi:hypothetical protein